MILPPPLRKGDVIAILSPSGAAVRENVEKAAEAIHIRGYEPRIMPHALGRHGSFSGSEEERLSDFTEAWHDPCVKALLCSRGGYGAVHLLPALDRMRLEETPKWLIGFSDISALHALMQHRGIASLHGPQTRHLALHPDDSDPCTAALFGALEAIPRPLEWEKTEFDTPGTARGTLRGGNLAVISALIGTQFNPFKPGSILVIEDIAEPIYKVERTLCQLRMAGLLDSLNGIVVGQFTDYHPDVNHASMEAMIGKALCGLDIPVAFNAPVGHVERNMPLILGSEAILHTDASGSRLTF